ncbi:MAG: Fic family protein, partial [Deltaproteobacteria bacterium]|nr:Fic family protein [Deltaproteobacteria bacterium]
MLRWKEKEDVEARFYQVDDAVERWKSYAVDASNELKDEFRDKLVVSLIFHDSALEGEVLTYGELKAAIDQNIISDTSLIPAYEETKNFFVACTRMLKQASNKKKPLKLEVVKDMHDLVAPEQAGAPYRKDNPLHRLYYHEIAQPEKIAYRMRKFGEWLESPACKDMHPIQRAAEAHWEFMAIFPWLK